MGLLLLYIPIYGVRFLPCVCVWLLPNCNESKLLYVRTYWCLKDQLRLTVPGHLSLILANAYLICSNM